MAKYIRRLKTTRTYYLWKGRGRRWTASTLTSLCEMIRYRVRFMYVCDLARVWRPPTPYGVHTLLGLGLHPYLLRPVYICVCVQCMCALMGGQI